MSPSTVVDIYPAPVDPRPFKRIRTDSLQLVSEQQQQQQPLDHIFIAESLVQKKPGGKKAPLSCCECRRLKLKCDRSFPCGSCKKRGVSDICPDGVLVSGKGTRFILANTEQLHAKIHEMSDRIRLLEEALDSVEPNNSLLDPELLNVKSTMGLYGTSQTGNEVMASSPSRHLNRSNGTQKQESPSGQRTPEISPQSAQELEAEIVRLSHSFPLASPRPSSTLRGYARTRLPHRREAEYLWEVTKENALWQYNPHPHATFFPNLLHHCYESSLEELNPRRLGLMFMILALGCLVDVQHRMPDSPDSEAYHTLGRACLCEIPVMEDTDVDTITALFYEIWYLMVFSDRKKAAAYAWGLMGLTAKLAQSINLHRNYGSRGKVIPEEVDKRKSLFWELLYLDARLSLSLGRPPSLSFSYVDCDQPLCVPVRECADPSESLQDGAYQDWKYSCYVQCLTPVLDAISQPSLDYQKVLLLDRKIRDFQVPRGFDIITNPSRSFIMQKGTMLIALEAVLLQLHRAYFTRAISGAEIPFNRSHIFAPSVVAMFLSSSRMIANIYDLYHREPLLTSRLLGYWSNAFSAVVALCILISRAPFTCLTPAALQELERARALFEVAKVHCPRAAQISPVLEKMIGKANDIYTRWSKGQDVPTIILRHTDDYRDEALPQSSGTDPFRECHPSLTQCIAEVHERAKILLPQRKPCQCGVQFNSNQCPPSHSWAPPPPLERSPPVLPILYAEKLAQGVQDTRSLEPSPISPTSKYSLDTINFEVGALNPGSDHAWMAWF